MSGFEYRTGRRSIESMPMDASSAAIVPGDAITVTGATDGYVQKADGDGDTVVGIAFSKVTAGSADGDVSVLVDVSTESVYEVGGDGTLTVDMANNPCDVAADAQTIDINGSTKDDIDVISINVTTQKARVRILRSALGAIA